LKQSISNEKEFTIEFWYRYRGGDEKDFDEVNITATTYEKAVEILKNTRKNIFGITNKTKPNA
jgi:hypothetical protein